MPYPSVTVPFRSTSGSAGVVDIQQLERRLKNVGGTGTDAVLDSAEYALQLVRFPYRQVWGDVAGMTISDAFTPKVKYQDLVTNTFIKDVR
jgi:hypothetical protein